MFKNYAWSHSSPTYSAAFLTAKLLEKIVAAGEVIVLLGTAAEILVAHSAAVALIRDNNALVRGPWLGIQLGGGGVTCLACNAALQAIGHICHQTKAALAVAAAVGDQAVLPRCLAIAPRTFVHRFCLENMRKTGDSATCNCSASSSFCPTTSCPRHSARNVDKIHGYKY